MMDRCPLCGADVGVGAGGWRSVEGAVFSSGSLKMDEGVEWERRRPGRNPEPRADVGVPCGVAVGSFAVCLFLGAVVGLVKWEGLYLVYGLVGGAVICALAWFALVWEMNRHRWDTERLKRAEGKAEKKGDTRELLEVQVSDGKRRVEFDEIDVLDVQQMKRVALYLGEGCRFTRREMCPGAFPERLYASARDEMVGLGYLRVNGEKRNAGVGITAKGRALFRGLGADLPAPGDVGAW